MNIFEKYPRGALIMLRNTGEGIGNRTTLNTARLIDLSINFAALGQGVLAVSREYPDNPQFKDLLTEFNHLFIERDVGVLQVSADHWPDLIKALQLELPLTGRFSGCGDVLVIAPIPKGFKTQNPAFSSSHFAQY